MSNQIIDDDVAILAAATGVSLKNLFQGSNPREFANAAPAKIADWRQFTSQNQRPVQQYPGQQQYPQQHPQQYPQPYGYGLPENVPMQPVQLLNVPVGVDEQGRVITTPPQQHPMQNGLPAQPQPPVQDNLQTGGFVLPSFNINKPSTNDSSDLEEKIDHICKELKELKKLTNKLIRLVSDAKVTKKPTENIERENTDKSENPFN